MTESMVERVAKAIANCGPVGCCIIDDDKAAELAIAAIEAMREPTERMLRAADSWTDLVGAYPEANTPEERRSEFHCAWIAMIDAALEEGK